MILRGPYRKRRPGGVSSTWRLCRSNNCTPSFCSRLFTDLLNQGCETCKRFWAALVKCSSSPTATKLFSLSRSTFIDIQLLSDRLFEHLGTAAPAQYLVQIEMHLLITSSIRFPVEFMRNRHESGAPIQRSLPILPTESSR